MLKMSDTCIYCGRPTLLTGDFNGICGECRARRFSELIAHMQEIFVSDKTIDNIKIQKGGISVRKWVKKGGK
jgi:hypothetical protein